MKKKIEFYNSNGQKLAGILSEASTKDFILVMAHGFSSNKNTENFVKLAESLADKKIPSLRFDFYGHGDSEGKFEEITISEAVDDILQAISFVKSLGYSRIGLLGSSFGGISSIMAASKTNALKFLALKSPVSDYWALEKEKYSPEELAEWKRVRYIDYIDDDKHLKLNYSFVDDFDNHNAYEAAKKIGVPTLIVHGDADTDVPFAQSQKLIICLANGKLHVVLGADHRYTDEGHAKEMRDAFFNFIVENSRQNLLTP